MAAKENRLEEIDANVYIQNYNSLKRIAMDNMAPVAQVKEVLVRWGPTGVGKSRKTWEEATLNAYPKIPTMKFWDGYRPDYHENVVFEEFTGQIDITHMLRWLDRYPVVVETKGSGCVLKCKKIWITSNVNPDNWYPNATQEQRDALRRRMTVIHCPLNLY